MKFKKLQKCINQLEDGALVKILNEIYEWKNTGLLNQDSLFKSIYNDYEDVLFNVINLENQIMYEAHKRFENVVKVLIVNNPGLYIR